MVVKESFFIDFENKTRSFFPGETIVGRVVIQNTKPTNLNCIRITFIGMAEVLWSQGSSGNYSASEQYFGSSRLIFGNAYGNAVTVPAGTSFYPFQFTLPLNLPSSFINDGSNGAIHYLIKATINRLWQKDIILKVSFTVNEIFDLNTEPGVNQEVEYQKQKTISFCFISGPVGYKIKLPCTGFVPGQFVDFSGEFTNRSPMKINFVKLSLLQYVTFHTYRKSISTCKELETVYSNPILKGDLKRWGGHVLKIPPVPPSRLDNCKIIDLHYKLKFEMDISGFANNLILMIPITIGTIPFVNNFGELMPNASSVGATVLPQPSAPTAGFSGDIRNFNPSIPTAPIFEIDPDLPPPTYAESLVQICLGTTDIIEPENAIANATLSLDNSALNEVYIT